MKKSIKICIPILSVALALNIQASIASPIYITNINPADVRPGGDGAIFLNQLAYEKKYTVTCDIENPNYNKQYPVIIYVSTSLGVDPSVKFIVNDKEPKYKQTLLNQAINKYVAIGVQRTDPHPYVGIYLYIRSYDDSDTIYIRNCIATEMD